jgi:autotransporter-associated beta strand protein
MLRVAQKLYRKITVPSDGKWRVVFKRGCRPGDNFYSLFMPTVVKVGSDMITTFPAIGSKDARHPFERFETDIMELQAGEYTLEVSLPLENYDDKNKSMNFDAFKLEKVEIVEVTGTLVKTGSGTLRMSGVDDGTVLVEGGRLSFESATVSDSRVEVDGGTLEFVDAGLDENSVVSVKAGSTLAFADAGGVELIANGSFEAEGAYKDYVSKNPLGWSGNYVEKTDLNNNGFGLQGNGGNVTPEKDDGPYTAHGTVTAYLREHCSMSQKVTVAEEGVYRLEFTKACRSTLYSNTMPLYVLVDGETVLESGESEKFAYRPFSVEFPLTPGEYTIEFRTGEPTTRQSAGAMLFIDDVHLRQVKPQRDIVAGTLEMAAGSTLHLGNRNRFRIRNFTVGGKAVTGGRDAAEAAGVTVTGAGKVRFGEPGGMLIIAR